LPRSDPGRRGRSGVPAGRTTRPTVTVAGADCSAHAAPEATGAPGLDSAHLALALEDPALTKSAECRS